MREPFEKVVARHADAVLRVCRVLLGAHDAEDAWSETFLAALRAYPDLPETANTEAWLVTIAHRKAIDVLRARKRQPAPVGEVPEAPTTLGVPGEQDADLFFGRKTEVAELMQILRAEPAVAQLAHDHWPDVVVPAVPALQVLMTGDDVLFDRLAEVRHNVRHDPGRGRLVQPRAPGDVAD